VVYCSVCGEELSRETVSTDKLAHTEATREENREEATCGKAGSYDLVTYCSVCSTVIGTETKSIPATGEHSFGAYESIGGDLEQAVCENCDATDIRVEESVGEGGIVDVVPEENEDDKKSEASVGMGLLNQILHNKQTLNLNSKILDVFFNAEALDTIANEHKGKTTISLVVEEKTEEENCLIFDLYLRVDGEDQKHTEFGGKNVTVTIPLDQYGNLVGKKVTVQYLPDNGEPEVMESELDRNGKSVQFTTKHFSTYTVLVEDCFDHEYGEDDTCTICGTEKTENPPAGSEGDDIPVVPEPMKGSIRLRSATLNLLDKVCIVYGVTDDNISTNPEEVAVRGVLLYDSAEKAATKDPTQAYAMVEMEWSEKDKMYRGQTEGIDARDMNKSQFAVAYLKLVDGTEIFGTKNGAEHIVEYSPLIYCQNKKDDALVGTLCRALMHYGAAAQVSQYPDDPGPLMNEGFEVIAYDESVLGENVFEANTQKINGMKLKAVTLDLKGAISYIVKYEADTSVTADKALYAEYILAKKNGTETGSVELVKDTSGGTWSATISGVPPKDMGATLTVKPYYLDENGEKVYGGELVYSGYEYVRRAQANANYAETTKELARALAMYIDAANAYGNKA